MQYVTMIFVVNVVTTFAAVYVPLSYTTKYSYTTHDNYNKVRHTRDVNWEKNAGNGKVFGTLGGTDESLFGRGGYKQDIFNDNNGRLEGQAYGSRTLGPYGDSSALGGKLNWSNDHAKLGADLQRQIGGSTGLTINGQGSWNLNPNTRLNVGGNLHNTFGHSRPDLRLQAELIIHNFRE